MGAAFVSGLIGTIKKYKSFEMKSWTKYQVDQLVTPIERHVKAARAGKSRREGVLKTINRYWGLQITGFFCSHNESQKTFCQLAHLSSFCFSYCKVQRLVNFIVVERLLTGASHHLLQYNPTTTDWDVIANRYIT